MIYLEKYNMEHERIRKFRGLEIAMDNLRMESHLLPEGYDTSDLPNKPLEYFKQYGFKVSSAFPEIYSHHNGIRDDRYVPASLYFYYINPYLVNMNLSMAYVDKNMYSRHFPSVRQPETIAHNMAGHFYTGEMVEMTRDEVINRLRHIDRFIIKPAIESGCGRDVAVINGGGNPRLDEILDNYRADYIIQRLVVQHSTLSHLNPTSLNTCRLITYRRVGTSDYILLGALVRFGGNGTFIDNSCTGGGFCKIYDDGKVDDKIHKYRCFGWGSLFEEKGVKNMHIPNYERVVKTALRLHRSIPYMDLIGWDIAVDAEGEPMLIELNQYPDCEGFQIANGPMFGDYTDELMERISKHHIDPVTVYKRTFDSGRDHYAYNIEIGKAYSI